MFYKFSNKFQSYISNPMLSLGSLTIISCKIVPFRADLFPVWHKGHLLGAVYSFSKSAIEAFSPKTSVLKFWFWFSCLMICSNILVISLPFQFWVLWLFSLCLRLRLQEINVAKWKDDVHNHDNGKISPFTGPTQTFLTDSPLFCKSRMTATLSQRF